MGYSTGFGYIVINGKRFNHDIVVHVDGSITKRNKELSKPFKKGFHTPLAPPEVEPLLDEKPEVFIIGSGQYGALPVLEETKNIIKNSGVELVLEKTPKALKTFMNLRKNRKVVAIFHVTC